MVSFLDRGRPQRTSASFRGEGGTQLQTFADMRGGGVSGMQTSALFKITSSHCLSKTQNFLPFVLLRKNISYKLKQKRCN